MKRNPEETMKEAVPMNEKEALKKACDIVEAKIRERGGQMHTKSQIRTYKVGDEIVVRLDDVLELARVMKNKFREGKEPGYISRTEAEKISAFLALNHFQVVLLSNELSKVDNIDDHKRVITEHSGSNKKPLVVPGRYAVGRKYDEDHDYWMFYADMKNGKPVFSNRPCMAKLYLSYKEAEASRDFLDDGDWDVVDLYDFLPPDQRLVRCIFAEEGWDEGRENAVVLHF